MKCQTLLRGKPFYFGKQKTTLFVLKAETNITVENIIGAELFT